MRQKDLFCRISALAIRGSEILSNAMEDGLKKIFIFVLKSPQEFFSIPSDESINLVKAHAITIVVLSEVGALLQKAPQMLDWKVFGNVKIELSGNWFFDDACYFVDQIGHYEKKTWNA